MKEAKYNLTAFNTIEPKPPIIYGFGVGFNASYNKMRYNLAAFNVSNGVGYLEVTFKAAITGEVKADYVVYYDNVVMSEVIDAEIEGQPSTLLEVEMHETVGWNPVVVPAVFNDVPFTETVQAEINGTANFQLSVEFSEKVGAEIDGNAMRNVEVTMSEEVSAEPIPAIATLSGIEMAEKVGADIDIASDTQLSVSFAETVTAQTSIGQDVSIAAVSMAGTVLFDGDISQNVNIAGIEYRELITATASWDMFDEKTCVLTLTLKPGDKLIIDAGTYNVWLNDKNAVYTQSGDWIDELNRNTVLLEVLAASGASNLSTKLYFQEMYL